VIDLGVTFVPEDVAAFRVEEDHAFGQDVDGFAQPGLGLARLALRPLQRRATAESQAPQPAGDPGFRIAGCGRRGKGRRGKIVLHAGSVA